MKSLHSHYTVVNASQMPDIASTDRNSVQLYQGVPLASIALAIHSVALTFSCGGKRA